MHRDLRLAGQLPPLDAPHHMRADEWRAFREGVVAAAAPGAGSMLDVGLDLVCPCLPQCMGDCVSVRYGATNNAPMIESFCGAYSR